MEPIKHILTASDLSPRADPALARAVQLAAQHGAALEVLHVAALVTGTGHPADNLLQLAFGSPTAVEAEVKRDAETRIAEKLATLPRIAKVPHTVSVRIGTPFLDIILAARAAASELIVLGAHGAGMLRKALLGTTAERVVRKGDRPVLVVRRAARSPYRRVLAAVDFSEVSRRALQAAVRLAPGAHLVLVHAYEIPYLGKLRTGGATDHDIEQVHAEYRQQALTRLRALAADAGLDPDGVTCEARHGHPAMVLLQAIAEHRAELAAVGTTGLAGLRYVLLGSVAEHILREARSDVLVVHPQVVEFALP